MIQPLINRHPALRPYLKDMLVLEGCEQVRSSNTFRFFADGCPGIVFHQSAQGILLNENQYPAMSVFLYGQTLKPVHIATQGRFRVIIFFLYPHAIMPLLGIKADELTDTCFDMSPLPTLSGRTLQDQLFHTDAVPDQVEIISSCLLRMLQLNHSRVDRILDFAVNRIWASRGEASLNELQKTLNVSERTFERRFEQYVGISPRLFARICRFQSTLDQLKRRNFDKLSDVAFDNGYADQSHFIRSFKEFTGFSPLKLRQYPDPFAENRAAVY